MSDQAALATPRDHIEGFLRELERPDGRLFVQGELWSHSFGDSKLIIAEVIRRYLAADRSKHLERRNEELERKIHQYETDNLPILRSQVQRLRDALERALIGVNHIATYRSDAWPGPGIDPEVALQKLGAGREYDMWCCWSAAMKARDLAGELLEIYRPSLSPQQGGGAA